MWEKRIEVQDSQCGKQELGHRCGHCSPCPRTVQWGSRQRGSPSCFHRKKQRELWAHKASVTAVPRELETLECGCQNQDFINRGRRRENYQGNFPQIHVRKRAEDLIITCNTANFMWYVLNCSRKERILFSWNANGIFNQEFVPLGGGSCQQHFSFHALCSPGQLARICDPLTFWMPCYPKIRDFWPLQQPILCYLLLSPRAENLFRTL